LKKFLSIILSILIVAQSAWALDRYVNPACEAACDGTTWEKGWATLADITWTDLDDETSNLYLGAGTYNEQLNVTHNTTGSILTIKPYNGLVTIDTNSAATMAVRMNHGYVTIDGYYEGLTGSRGIRLTGSAYGIGHWNSGLSYITYRYLEVDTNDTHGIHINGTAGATTNLVMEYLYIHDNGAGGVGGDGIVGNVNSDQYGRATVRYCTISGNLEDGINIGGGTDVYNNTIDMTGSENATHPDAIQGSGGYHRIYNNTFILPANQGIFIETVDTDLPSVRIYNNTFNGGAPAVLLRIKNLVGEGNHTISDFLLANNTIDATTFGLRIFQDVEGTTLTISSSEISNNIFYGSDPSHMLIHEAGTGTVTYTKAGLSVYSNVFYNPDAVGYNASDDGGGPYDTAADLNTGTSFTGNTNSQPTFTNYAGGDYALSSSDTAAKTAGKDLSAIFTVDRLGLTRTVPWSIGAYEYVETGSIHGVTSMGVSKK